MPTNELGLFFETFRYQAFFNSNPEAAAKELAKDIRRTIRATLRTVDSPPPSAFLKSNESFLRAWDHIEEVNGHFTLYEKGFFNEDAIRSHQYHSFPNKKRTISFHNTNFLI